MLYHLTTREAWQHAVGLGTFRTESLESDGFINLSTEDQWPRTHARFFSDAIDLVLLVIDPERVTDVRWEAADGEAFPHLYDALAIDAVVEVREL